MQRLFDNRKKEMDFKQIYNIAMDKIQQSRYKDALSLLLQQDTSLLNPEQNKNYLYLKGRCLHGMSEFGEAEKTFKSIPDWNENNEVKTAIRFLDKDIKNTDALLKEADQNFQDGLFKQSLIGYKKIIATCPGYKKALLGIARSHENSNEQRFAQKAYEELLKNKPDEYGFFYICKFLIKTNQHEQAKIELDKALMQYKNSDLLISLNLIHFPTSNKTIAETQRLRLFPQPKSEPENKRRVQDLAYYIF